MIETLRLFIQRIDFAWFLELGILSLSWVILCEGTLRSARARFRAVRRFVLLYLTMSAMNLLVVALGRTPARFNILWSIAQGLVAAAYIRFCSSYQKRTKILLWSALYTAGLSIVSIAGQCSILVGEFIIKGPVEGVVRCVIFLLVPLVAAYLRRFNFDDYSVVPNNGLRLIGFGTFGILTLNAVNSLFFQSDYHVTITLLAAFLCMFGMVLIAIRVMYTMCREQTELLELQTEKQRLLSEREMTQMTEAKLDDLRCIRHDLKNQYAYMQILLSEKRYEELQDYFAKLSENLPEQLNTIDCGNRTMNTILNMEFAKLKSDRITVEHQLVVPPVLPFPDEDVCSIVANLLDNAAEECRRLLQNGRDSVRVRLEIYPHQSYLYIKCSNSTDRQTLDRRKGGLRTTKSDEQIHGYGTRIVTKLSEKHNGCADYSLADGRFIAQVMLDMTEGGAA